MGSMIKLFEEKSPQWMQLIYVVLLLAVLWLIYDGYVAEHLSGSNSWVPDERKLSAVAMGR